jgi:protein-disulfide isomerase
MAIPIPKRASGFTLGDPNALVKIEAFVDIQCPHSKMIWPQLLQVLAHYSNKPVSLTIHLITLSNHRQAWDMSLGLFALAEGDPQRFFDFATFLYANQESFYNGPFRHKTHEDLRLLVADFAFQHKNTDKQALLTRMDDSDVYVAARTPIRYAATRSVWATPTLFINNADDVPLAPHSPVLDYISLIDEIL